MFYDAKATSLLDEDDEDPAPLALGKSLDFLGFFNLEFELEQDYGEAEFKFDFMEITGDEIPVIRIQTREGDIQCGDEKLQKVYFDGSDCWYKDDGWQSESFDPLVQFDEMEMEVSYERED